MVQVNLLYFIIYACLASMLPFLVVFVLSNQMAKRKEMSPSISHSVLVVLFAFYIFAALYVTSAGTLYDLVRYGVTTQGEQINLFPFSRNIHITGYLLNTILFMPLGILPPLIWADFRKVIWALISGLSFSLLIEISQLFNNRRTDVDDLIMNTLGAMLGYLIFKAFFRSHKWDAGKTGGGKWEPVLYVCVLFMGRFLLYDELGLAKALYGF